MRAFVRGKQSNDFLKLTLDRKVSPDGWYQKRRHRWVATIPNSFGLPPGITCPGLTPFCDSCYAKRSERQSGVALLLAHNHRMLTEAATVDGMAYLLDEAVSRLEHELRRRDVPAKDWVFRKHWSGDYYSIPYALAWKQVMLAHQDMGFFVYTRSLAPPVDVVPTLVDVPNLTLYLSVDVWNADLAAKYQNTPGVLLAPCAVDYDSAKLLPGGDDALVCPENRGLMRLMANGRGACVTCRVCPDGRRNVIFSTSHRDDVNATPVRITRKPRGARPADGPIFVGVCAGEECDTELYRQPGKAGRNPKYCDDCRVVVYRKPHVPSKEHAA